MAYEIDFLPVGDGERSGDAISLRFGNFEKPNEQTVVVLDGGTKESGAAVVSHIEHYYGTNIVDAAVCTHSDADHASGLTEVLENLNVKRLCMHLPWNHAADLEEQLSKASTTDSVRQHFKKSLDSARQLEALAKKKGIPVFELFSDTSKSNSAFTVLGPSTAFYEGLLESFRCAEELNLKESSFLGKAVAAAAKVADRAVKWVAETWDAEAIVEPHEDACSAENNSSLILLFTHEGSKFLFTSDAGVLALTEAANYADRIGLDLQTVNGIQVPHHGSKRNVGPAILDRIVGPKLKSHGVANKDAIVSASMEGAPKHPSKRVVNAFIRRGAGVAVTQGKPLCTHSPSAPTRPGWSSAVKLPFYDKVEEE